ncbi:hypothetical protein HDU79_009801 [Rhizoclosmatium sp. JEL0117]|nr:hypothetical protein HDU79_009801 [Rhizoclosmatium sp. JEL0117]
MLPSIWTLPSILLITFALAPSTVNGSATECVALHDQIPEAFATADSAACSGVHTVDGSKILDTQLFDNRIISLTVSGYGLTKLPQLNATDFDSIMNLDLSNNKMTGDIDTFMSNMGKYVSTLDLSSNLLTGSIPASLADRLSVVDENCFDDQEDRGLSLNHDCPQYSADCDFLKNAWPSAFTSVDANKCLSVDEEAFIQKKITSSLDGKTISTLTAVGIGLLGPLPDLIQLTKLTTLDLSDNSLTGSLTPSLLSFLQQNVKLLPSGLDAATLQELNFNCFDNNDDYNLTGNPACPQPEPCQQLNNIWPKVFINPNAVCCPLSKRRDLSERSCRRDLNVRCKRELDDWIQFSKRQACDPCANPCCTPPFSHGGGGSLVIDCNGAGNTFQGFALDSSTINEPLPDFSGIFGLVNLKITNSKFTGPIPKLPEHLQFLDLTGNLLGFGESYPDSEFVGISGNCFTGDPDRNPNCPVASTEISTVLTFSSSTAVSTIPTSTLSTISSTVMSSATSTVSISTTLESSTKTITLSTIDTSTVTSKSESLMLTIAASTASTPSISSSTNLNGISSSALKQESTSIPPVSTNSASLRQISTSLAATASSAESSAAKGTQTRFMQSTISVPTSVSTTTPFVCVPKAPTSLIASIAAGPIPSGTPMQNYNGDTTEIIASLNALVPGSLNQLNANQVGSSLFQITEPIRAGDAPVTFLGAPFGAGSNAVVVLITSRQYKFNGLPSADNIQVYNDATCSFKINTATIGTTKGVGFSYVLDSTYTSEWFSLDLNAAGTTLTVSVYSENKAIASIAFSVSLISGKRADGDVGFVVVNGVGVVNKPVETRSVTASIQKSLISTSETFVPSGISNVATTATTAITASTTTPSTSKTSTAVITTTIGPILTSSNAITSRKDVADTTSTFIPTRTPEQTSGVVTSVVSPAPTVSQKLNIVVSKASANIVSTFIVVAMIATM